MINFFKKIQQNPFKKIRHKPSVKYTTSILIRMKKNYLSSLKCKKTVSSTNPET